MKLSICVVTMNRAEQLKEALESCLACQLPAETEFIVVDNASTDNTDEIVAAVLSNNRVFYEKMKNNIGCGGGRNYAFDKSNGEYVYMLDDDAVIDINNPQFFCDAIEIMDTHPEFATLTTQIYDTAWIRNRVEKTNLQYDKGIFGCKMFCGGSHFLRKAFFTNAPYFPNKYGYEEIPPSLIAADAEMKNAFCEYLLVIHKPRVNKWVPDNEQNYRLLVNECGVQYAIKRMMYPGVFFPVIWLAYKSRCKKYLAKTADWKKNVSDVVKSTMKEYPIHYKVRFKTIWHLYRNFGISVF